MRKDLTLYFIRHGETDWNRAQRYQGQTDVPLNALGREQAARNGRVLKDVLNGVVPQFGFVASPLIRAAETMRIVRREMSLGEEPFARDDRLKEQHFGVWEGKLYGELPTIDPVGFAARQADMWGWAPVGGETYQALEVRLRSWLADLSGNAVVASHGNVGRALRGILLGLDNMAVPRLDAPQDKVLVLRGGTAEWL